MKIKDLHWSLQIAAKEECEKQGIEFDLSEELAGLFDWLSSQPIKWFDVVLGKLTKLPHGCD